MREGFLTPTSCSAARPLNAVAKLDQVQLEPRIQRRGSKCCFGPRKRAKLKRHSCFVDCELERRKFASCKQNNGDEHFLWELVRGSGVLPKSGR